MIRVTPSLRRTPKSLHKLAKGRHRACVGLAEFNPIFQVLFLAPQQIDRRGRREVPGR